ncbi:MAG: hypothetical protein P0S96_04055 [Simkaniaceae bacterium]|nr:hypothetical protein [Candidatus Sacchlamyda saccharinae]
MSTHNIDFYINLWDKYERLKEDNQTRQRNRSLINPQNFLINPIADLATDLVCKSSTWAYLSTGKALVGITRPLHANFAHRIEDAWQDPISTETMLKIGKLVQSIARFNAVRKPTLVPLFHFFDRSLIAFTQHVHVVSGDLIELLKIPKNLHRFINAESQMPVEGKEHKKTDLPTTLSGKTWQYVKIGVAKAVDALFALIELVVKVTRVLLQRVPIVEKVLGNAKSMVVSARARAYSFLLGKAYDLIRFGEKKARHQVTSRVARIVYRQAIRTAIGTSLQVALATSVYQGANYVFTQYTGAQEFPPEMVQNASRAMKVIGGYLWVRCVTPTLKDLYEDYNDDFKPSSSTFIEVSNILNTKNIAPLVSFAKKKLDIK